MSHHFKGDKDRRAERKGRQGRRGKRRDKPSSVGCHRRQPGKQKGLCSELRIKHERNTIHTHKTQQVKKHRQRLTNRKGKNVEFVQRLEEAVLILHIKTLTEVYQDLKTMHFSSLMVYGNATILKMISFFFLRVIWFPHIQFNLSQNVFAINDYSLLCE